MELSGVQRDRAAGVILGNATGDALGVPYEFKPTLRPHEIPSMVGGGLGPYEPGEYSDDTQMAVMVAAVMALGYDLRTTAGLSAVVANFLFWRKQGATDIGAQTASVLDSVRCILAAEPRRNPAAVAAHVSRGHHIKAGRSGGNGSLMRTSPVALGYLAPLRRRAMADAARKVSALTHFDPEAGDACVLWCEAIRHAVLTGRLDMRRGLRMVPAARRKAWAERIAQAEAGEPASFRNNGWVVSAFQAAYSAVTRAMGDHSKARFVDGITRAVRAGNDTDTIAAIAGSLLGALYGASAIPSWWPVDGIKRAGKPDIPARRVSVSGWPGQTAQTLTAMPDAIIFAQR